VTARNLEPLKALAKLERLDLSNCKRLRDDVVPVLSSMKQLKAVDLKDSAVTEQGIAKLRAALPQCEVRF
jgi:selenocysteine-specific translation elongation factor